MSSTAAAPGRAARIIHGRVRSVSRRRLRRYVFTNARVRVAAGSGALSREMPSTGGLFSFTTRGSRSRRTTGTTTRAIANRSGNRTKAMASTTGLKEGELIMAARVSRVLAPLTRRLCAMGVAQLVQTPAGAPASEPQRMLAVAEAKRLGRL